ncbi:synaptosomal-associated protein 47 isoform X2 [Ochotona princeps]|uniref:synaptosomal-associated protein 47 isoform X2 n=1 Tax=Ochotona princeps TaxID=9978 RepID=UPI00271483AD|nr:synaptosomal-associated protein 47 isoform X2 [Ochotona princeps]
MRTSCFLPRSGQGPESGFFPGLPGCAPPLAPQRERLCFHVAQLFQEKMSKDICIHAWPCCYYLDPEKRWVHGKLSLTSHSLKFTADRTGEILVGFPLASIIEMKKEASHFIFSSITILEKDHAKHWFSSLQPNRNAVFTIIEHFWRELLLSQAGASVEAMVSPLSRGKELTGMMAGSQKRLEDTAKVLHHQGEQLSNAMRCLEKMESDLDVADRLLTELESPSWWPFSPKFWKIPSEPKPREGASAATCEPFGKEGILIVIPGIISGRTESHTKPGRLTILISGLEIHDSNSLLLHRFEREDIDDIKVHSPYEISIRQRFIGKPDVVYRVLSAKMPKVVPILEVQFSKRIELLEDAFMFRTSGVSSSAEKSCSVWHTGTVAGSWVGSKAAGAQTSIPIWDPGITSDTLPILKKMKGLALDAEAELERQDEALDGITAAVDRATLIVDKHNRRMRKLT